MENWLVLVVTCLTMGIFLHWERTGKSRFVVEFIATLVVIVTFFLFEILGISLLTEGYRGGKIAIFLTNFIVSFGVCMLLLTKVGRRSYLNFYLKACVGVMVAFTGVSLVPGLPLLLMCIMYGCLFSLTYSAMGIYIGAFQK